MCKTSLTHCLPCASPAQTHTLEWCPQGTSIKQHSMHVCVQCLMHHPAKTPSCQLECTSVCVWDHVVLLSKLALMVLAMYTLSINIGFAWLKLMRSDDIRAAHASTLAAWESSCSYILVSSIVLLPTIVLPSINLVLMFSYLVPPHVADPTVTAVAVMGRKSLVPPVQQPCAWVGKVCKQGTVS